MPQFDCIPPTRVSPIAPSPPAAPLHADDARMNPSATSPYHPRSQLTTRLMHTANAANVVVPLTDDAPVGPSPLRPSISDREQCAVPSTDDLPPLVRAQDDMDVDHKASGSLVAATFDMNRSYTNDGRGYMLVASSSSATATALGSAPPPLQSVPTCGTSTSVAGGTQRHLSSAQSKQRSAAPTSMLWRFRKEMVIGSGADGKVFLAVDLRTNERMAVKEIIISGNNTHRTLLEAQEDSKKIGVMKRQIDTLRKLPPHPNVVQHTSAERTTCALNVMMEYVAGGSISALLSKLGAFQEAVVRLYTRHICSALAFLHKNGVIHRDIKGANCLIGVDGVVKVCDFGCCIIAAPLNCSEAKLQGDVKGIHGTSMWMSPESIQNTDVITPKADIWSLACTVIEMATGRPPWYEAHFTNEWAAMFHISQAKRGPPIPAHLSRQCHDFLRKCFAVDPSDRPSAEECLEHPFLTADFKAGSSDPDMMPPTPSDMSTLQIPTKHSSHSHSSIQYDDSVADSSDYEPSNYSSFNQGVPAVYDQEWGDAETAVDDEDAIIFDQQPVQSAAVADESVDPLVSRSPRTTTGTPGERHGGVEPLRFEASSAVTPVGLPEAKKSEVSLETIDHFLRESSFHPGGSVSTPRPTTSSGAASTGGTPGALGRQHLLRVVAALHNDGSICRELDDAYGIGLPEPILYTVFSFLDATSLCRVSCVSLGLRELADAGAKETLWKTLFLRIFGPVDAVQMSLRRHWKTYFRNSFLMRGVVVEDRYRLIRQRGQSERVFDGIDLHTQEPVVVKVEKWHLTNAAAAASASGKHVRLPTASGLSGSMVGSGAVSVSAAAQQHQHARAPSPSREAQFAGTGAGRLPSLTRTPTKAKPTRPIPPPLPPSLMQALSANGTLMSPQKERRTDDASPFARSSSGAQHPVVGLSRPPLPRSQVAATSPPKQRPPLTVPPLAGMERGASAPQPQHGSGPQSPASGGGGGGGGGATSAGQQPAPHHRVTGGRVLPRSNRLPSPSQFTITQSRRTGSPSSYRDGAVQFVFLQPSSLFPANSGLSTAASAGDSPEQRDSARHGSVDSVRGLAQHEPHSSSPHLSAARQHGAFSGSAYATHLLASLGVVSNPAGPAESNIPATTGSSSSAVSLNATLLSHPVKGGTGSGAGGTMNATTTWHELYDFQRTSDLAPLVTPKTLPKSLLLQDYRFLRHLEALGARSVPRLLGYYDNDSERQQNFLVTSPLGPSLNELLLFCGNQLTLRTLSMLTLRLLDALEEIHERDVVHGNVSPTNIVTGDFRSSSGSSSVYLINFAHARFFRDPRTHRPNNTSTSSSADRARKHNEFLSFCSTYVQRKCTAAPRDDVIALGYVLCYLFHGGLPWTREKTLNVGDLLRQKTAYLETLQRTPPIQLHYFLKSGYALRQGEIPDYRYLKSLVHRMMDEKNWVDDGKFDWSHQLLQSDAST